MSDKEQLQKIIDANNQAIKEAHILGIQSGKKENSQLVSDFKKQVDVLASDVKDLKKITEDYIKLDTDWKTEYEPYMKGIANLTGSGKIVIWLAGAVTAIGAAWIVLKSHFK